MTRVERVWAKFIAYHEVHPETFLELHARARELQLEGHKRVSMKHLFEERRSGRAEALDNSFTSLYARVLMAADERLGGLFELRGTAHHVELEPLGIYKFNVAGQGQLFHRLKRRHIIDLAAAAS